MQHPELLLLPLLMLADYLLTIASAKAKETAYSRYFKQKHLELNPIWQKDVAAIRWINPRHLVLTFVLSTALICLFEFSQMQEHLALGFEGCIFALYACVLGRHISNLFIFRYVRTHVEALSGEIQLSHRLLLAISAYQLTTVMLPLVTLAALAPHAAVFGANAGIALLILVHGYWYYRAGKTKDP